MARRLPAWAAVVAAWVVLIAVILLVPQRRGNDAGESPPGGEAWGEFEEALERAARAQERGDWEAAQREADRASRLRPESPKPRVIRADVLRERGRWEEALALYEEALDIDRGMGAAWRGVALVRLRQVCRGTQAPLAWVEDGRVVQVLRRNRDPQRAAEAIQAFEQVIYLLPEESPERELARAAHALVMDQNAAAAALLLAGRGDYDALVLRATARFWSGEIERARADYEAAAKLRPEDPAHRPGLAAALWLHGHREGALQLLEDEPALRAWWQAMKGQDVEVPPDPAEPASWLLVGRLAMRRGNYAQALEPLQRALEAGYAPAHTLYAVCLERLGRREELRVVLETTAPLVFPEIYEISARVFSAEAEHLSREADRLHEGGRADEARSRRAAALARWTLAWLAFYEVHRHTPGGRVELPWTASQVERMERDFSAARAASNAPDPSHLIMRASLRLERGDARAAERDLRTAQAELERLGLEPDRAARFTRALSYWRARALESLGRWSEAVAERGRCWDVDPANLANALALVTHEFRTEQWDQVVSRTTQVARLRPFMPVWYEWRGLALEHSGRWEEGERDARLRCLLGDPEGPAHAAALAVLLHPPGPPREAYLAGMPRADAVRQEMERLHKLVEPESPAEDWERVAAEAAAAVDRDPAERRRLGLALVQLGWFREAESVLLQIPPQQMDEQTAYALGRCRWELGNLAAAKEALHMAVARAADYAQAYALLAEISRQQGDTLNGIVWTSRFLNKVRRRPFDAWAVPVVEEAAESPEGSAITWAALRAMVR